ncbi:hypothetical protein SAQ01S_26100 [Sphingomonas aquatilis NBRC 16722]|uniref:Uncharacterized protein (DUF2384 family) n=1 Tax=Sphingomonas aquatilis TaxID=93063 RepID=A0AAW3TV60_9SPHN|nr:antitoxin Xre/MbcA/ParS toxin-binding domain-containing protein [Sphingomonas aquatilis]MBB3877006.1 uncharacterized protein (DUF2384 family) [Sphingomonas aquatilis]GEM72844.1 hypothetical protein SAQ01S_26100 [Sphingomonas aquatilis NBRC 16722]
MSGPYLRGPALPLHEVLSRWDEVVNRWALDPEERCGLLGGFAPGPIDRIETYEVLCGEQRMRLLVELDPILSRIWRDERRIREWLRAANPSLADRPPIDVMSRSPEWVRWVIDNMGMAS